MDVHVRRVVPITYEMVAKAYQKVRKGGKSPGVDEESWAEFESKGVEKELYVIWNRMASGSYIPREVKRIEIPKKGWEHKETWDSYYAGSDSARGSKRLHGKAHRHKVS